MIAEHKIVTRLDELIDKGNEVIATAINAPNTESHGVVNGGAFAAWRAQVLNFLTGLLGRDHVYLEEFRPGMWVPSAYKSYVSKCQKILQALKEDILAGYLIDVKTLISAEVFSDFLGMADHLLECGYKDPAASLCGAVLENGLRRIASNADIALKPIESLSSLNSKCAEAGVYTELFHRRIQAWTSIRNNADHGKFSEYLERDVQDMLRGVKQFLEDYFRNTL